MNYWAEEEALIINEILKDSFMPFGKLMKSYISMKRENTQQSSNNSDQKILLFTLCVCFHNYIDTIIFNSFSEISIRIYVSEV